MLRKPHAHGCCWPLYTILLHLGHLIRPAEEKKISARQHCKPTSSLATISLVHTVSTVCTGVMHLVPSTASCVSASSFAKHLYLVADMDTAHKQIQLHALQNQPKAVPDLSKSQDHLHRRGQCLTHRSQPSSWHQTCRSAASSRLLEFLLPWSATFASLCIGLMS